MKPFHYAGTNPLLHIGYGFCNALYELGDKLENYASNMQIDKEVLLTVPRKYTEKKRKTKKPHEEVSGSHPLLKNALSESQIGVDAVLDGFDDECLQTVKIRIIDSGRFIIGNAETRLEKKLALRLAIMFQKGTVMITDTYLASNERIGAYFQPAEITEKPSSNGSPYIGLDIMTVVNNDAACLVNILAHEAYHALNFYTGNVEYSIIDETRAWNVGLRFSNKYRAMNGIPIERDREYTKEELEGMGAEYRNALNVNVRYGPGENLIEKIGYGVANLIEDAADTVDGWADRIKEKTV